MTPRGFPRPVRALALSDWTRLRMHLMWIYDGIVHPSNLVQEHYIPGQAAFLIRKGEVVVQNEKGSAKAGAGEWIFPREGFRLQRFTPGAEILSLHFHLAWPGGHRLLDFGTAVVIGATEVPQLEARARQLLRLVERGFPEARGRLQSFPGSLEAHLVFQQYLIAWLRLYVNALAARGIAPTLLSLDDPRILKAIQMLDRQPWGVPLREAELAAQIHLSTSQLNRLFVRHLGCTPNAYREQARMEEALSRLQGPTEPVKEIAFDLGFRSLSHFSSWLRRKVRLSPRQIRERKGQPLGSIAGT